MNGNRRKIFPSRKLLLLFLSNAVCFLAITLFLLVNTFSLIPLNTGFLVEIFLTLFLLLLWGGSLFMLTRITIETKFSHFLARLNRELDLMQSQRALSPKPVRFRSDSFIRWEPTHFNDMILSLCVETDRYEQALSEHSLLLRESLLKKDLAGIREVSKNIRRLTTPENQRR